VIGLLILLLFGWTTARCWVGERDLLTCVVLAPALGSVFFLLGVNGALLLGLTMGQAIWTALTLQTIAAAVALKTSPATPRISSRATWLSRLVLLGTSLLVWAFTNISQNLSPDDDYWIHTPLQGLLVRGRFPLEHPFFSEIPMGGHYGRDLLIAALSCLTGYDIFWLQAWHTTMAQVLAYLLLFLTILRFTGCQIQAILGSWFFLFGANAGGRGGMIDTYQNNNAMVYFQLVLLAYLIQIVWHKGRPAAAVIAGLVLGNYAIVYETHFGLMVLSMLTCCLVFQACKDFPISRAGVLAGLLVLVVAAPIAVSQGGPFTTLGKRWLGRQVEKERDYSPGELNQHQVVRLKFPKDQLFQIQLGYGNYQRISCVYSSSSWLSHLNNVTSGAPYRPIWSWDVLKLHWLSLYLAPLSLIVLAYFRNSGGVFYWAFGAWAFLVPSVCDFGPIYEFEYFRWEFASATALAVCLGMAAGEIASRALGSPRAGSIAGGCILVGGLLWANTLPFQRTFLPRVYQGYQRANLNLGGALMIMPTEPWIRHHQPKLRVEPGDLKVARWLRDHAHPGDRSLTNFSQTHPESILFESTLVGISGVRSVGHSLPLDAEPIGTPPYHMAAAARAFFEKPDLASLEMLKVDWICLRPPDVADQPLIKAIESLPGVRLAFETEGASAGQTHRLYQVTLKETIEVGVPGTTSSAVRWEDFDLFGRPGQPLESDQCYRATIRLSSAEKGRHPFIYVFGSRSKTRLDFNEAVPFWASLEKGSDVEIALVTPHQEGSYDLHLFESAPGGLKKVKGLQPSITVKYPELGKTP
jgi:hypothetical protein